MPENLEISEIVRIFAPSECRQRARNELLSKQYFKLDLSDHHTRT
jgi:hypothetical protein